MKSVLRRSAVPVVLVSLHSAAVLWAWWHVVNRPGMFSGLNWLPVAAMDFPLTLLIEAAGADEMFGNSPTVIGLTFLIGGGIYWLLIGLAVQAAGRAFLRRTEA